MLAKIGNRVKNVRKLVGITQEQLAKRTNLSLTSVSRLENGKAMVSIEKLINIAEALNTDLGIILCDYMSISDTSSSQEAELITKFRELDTIRQKSVVSFVDVMYRESKNDPLP